MASQEFVRSFEAKHGRNLDLRRHYNLHFEGGADQFLSMLDNLRYLYNSMVKAGGNNMDNPTLLGFISQMHRQVEAIMDLLERNREKLKSVVREEKKSVLESKESL